MTPHSVLPLSLRTAALLVAGLALPLTACATTPPTLAPAPVAAPVSSEATTASATPTPTLSATSASPTPTPAPKASASGYTMAQVRKHANAASCWTVISGNVYDLTKWVNRHPGGRARILSLCGKDGTAAFRAEHGKEKQPNQVLAGYKLGPLA